ncbi:MAG: hypothetical protein JO056_12475 [Alphaproteobacteria bacterium]|nr:hypothetical protein [Alphaproteobacteria bacterium]
MAHAYGNFLRRHEPDSPLPAIATALVLTLGFGISMAASLPGYLSYDSVIQLLEGRTGIYSGWHPPIMSWLLGLGDAVIPGTALFVAGNALLLLGAMLLLLRIARPVSWLAVPCALFCVLTPQFVLYQGTVWKDVLFANAAVAAFATLTHAVAGQNADRLRWLPAGAAFLLLCLAALVRQNGFLLLPFGGLALAWMAIRSGMARGRAILMGASAVVSSLVIVWMTNAALALRIPDDGGAAKQLRLLEFYDLAGAFADDPALDSPALRQRDSKLFERLKHDGAQLYSPVRSDTLARSAPLQLALAEAPENVLHKPWLEFVFSKPGTYLRHRAEIFRWVVRTPQIGACVPFIVGVRGPSGPLAELGLKARFSQRDRMANWYGRRLVGTSIFSHLTFLVLSLCEVAFLLYRRCATDLPWICLLGGSIVFSLSFFFLSLACDYRYLYLLDLSALATLYWVCLRPRRAVGG